MLPSLNADADLWYADLHPYYSRQNNRVVQYHIRALSPPGGLVVDPFVGSGVSALEAIAAGRRIIASDISPMAVFITNALVEPLDISAYRSLAWAIYKEAPFRHSNSSPVFRQVWGDERIGQIYGIKEMIESSVTSERKFLYLALSKSMDTCNNCLAPPSFEITGSASSIFNQSQIRIYPNPDTNIHEHFIRAANIIASIKQQTNRYQMPAQVLLGDVADLVVPNVNAIITDPPWGNIQYGLAE